MNQERLSPLTSVQKNAWKKFWARAASFFAGKSRQSCVRFGRKKTEDLFPRTSSNHMHPETFAIWKIISYPQMLQVVPLKATVFIQPHRIISCQRFIITSPRTSWAQIRSRSDFTFFFTSFQWGLSSKDCRENLEWAKSNSQRLVMRRLRKKTTMCRIYRRHDILCPLCAQFVNRHPKKHVAQKTAHP